MPATCFTENLSPLRLVDRHDRALWAASHDLERVLAGTREEKRETCLVIAARLLALSGRI